MDKCNNKNINTDKIYIYIYTYIYIYIWNVAIPKCCPIPITVYFFQIYWDNKLRYKIEVIIILYDIYIYIP